LTLAGAVWLWAIGTSHGTAAGFAQTPAAQAPVPTGAPLSGKALFDQYCVGCHNDRLKTGGLSLQNVDPARVAGHEDVFEKVAQKLQAGMMPPSGRPRPDPAVSHAFATSLEHALDAEEAAHPDPGGPLLHRLNRAEYANAIRDLLALDVDPAALLPPDDSSSGFDNVADALGVSPALMERYLSAADQVSALAVGDPAMLPASFTYHVRGDASQSEHVEGLPLGTRGGLKARPTLPLDGEYIVKVKLLQTNLGSVRGLEYPQQLEISVDGARVHLVPMGGPADFAILPENAEEIAEALDARLIVRVPISAGPHDIVATFIQRTDAQGGHRLQPFLRSNVDATDHTGLPHIESFTITGPFGTTATGDTPSRRRVFLCRPAAAIKTVANTSNGHPAAGDDEIGCATRIISTLARRAYRRPLTDADMARLMKLFDSGRRDGSFDSGIQFALRGILASAKFVFRGERDATAAGGIQPVSDLELASRLSFFLWSSIPDDELLSVASEGKLRSREMLDREVRRMLADPKAHALVENFAGQWLYLRNLKSTQPDQNEFPDFDDNLRQAFQQETELFFESVMREDRDVVDLLTADYTFVNERLARHYGMPNIYGSRFRRVTVTDDARKGLLGKGAILLVTSHAGRTSPVSRGKWILDNLLGTPPPPPPPDVPALEEKGGTAEAHSVRERLEKHRANPPCAGCHRMMDPLGLALENFDAVGAWRVTDEGSPIDASGQLLDGTRVDGVVTLRQAILRRPDLFVRTLTSKLLVYGLGRGLSYHDMPVVRGVVRDAAADDYRFSSLILGIVHSRPFQMRGSVD
jgi:cytochrome c551/c552